MAEALPTASIPVPSAQFRAAVYLRKDHDWQIQCHGMLQVCMDGVRVAPAVQEADIPRFTSWASVVPC